MDLMKYFARTKILLWIIYAFISWLAEYFLKSMQDEGGSSFRLFKKNFMTSFVPKFNLRHNSILWRFLWWRSYSNFITSFEIKFISSSSVQHHIRFDGWHPFWLSSEQWISLAFFREVKRVVFQSTMPSSCLQPSFTLLMELQRLQLALLLIQMKTKFLLWST